MNPLPQKLNREGVLQILEHYSRWNCPIHKKERLVLLGGFENFTRSDFSDEELYVYSRPPFNGILKSYLLCKRCKKLYERNAVYLTESDCLAIPEEKEVPIKHIITKCFENNGYQTMVKQMIKEGYL